MMLLVDVLVKLETIKLGITIIFCSFLLYVVTSVARFLMPDF